MKMDEILQSIKALAQSQGFYGRLYARLLELRDEDPESFAEIAEEWETQGFNNVVDLVLYIEC